MGRRRGARETRAVQINDRTVTALPRETILEAALRSGLDLPRGCRVGACGACRGRLREGQVRERTETGYLLSADELDQGYILACQSVPRSDVRVELDLSRRRSPAGPARGAPPPLRDGAAPALEAEAEALPPAAAQGSTSVAVHVLHHLKYFLFHAVGLVASAALLAGGRTITVALLCVVAFYVVGDAVCGDDTSTPAYRHPGVLTVQLWLALPLLLLIVFLSVWGVCRGDPLGFGAWVARWSGHDVLAARDATALGHRVSAWIATGLMIAMTGTIPAHELTHRTWDRASMLVGRWLLAFSLDTSFAIEHVYGHHRYVATAIDPATAPRGRSVYLHVIASTLKGTASAWRIEAGRLARRRLPICSWHNAFLRGQLMSALLLAGAFAMGGVRAALWLLACALWSKALLEIVNYMEHYGLVRDPRRAVRPRHSWNSNRRISSWSTFNLTRHSHHHAQGEVPYHDLRPYPDAPVLLAGYLTTIVIALVPPLWHRLMAPRLLAWDRDLASAEERALADRANARSGLRSLGAAA